VAKGTASCFACIRVYLFADCVDWPVLDFQGCTDSRKVASCCLVLLSSRGRWLKVNLFPGATPYPRCYQDIDSLILNAGFIKSLKTCFRFFFQAVLERSSDKLSRSQPLLSIKRIGFRLSRSFKKGSIALSLAIIRVSFSMFFGLGCV
jgi:hypothetical protein